jgi:DNA-binding NarL/FixJ family response regulator
MVRAIKAAAAGQVQLSPRAAATLVRVIQAPQGAEALTERETEVLRLLARGYCNKEMARMLGISDATVKTHVKNLLAKLGLTSRTQAALYALRIGLATLEAVPAKPCRA